MWSRSSRERRSPRASAVSTRVAGRQHHDPQAVGDRTADGGILAEVAAGAGLPAGVFNVVYGTGPVVGEAISGHPGIDMVSFTGSTRAGRRISAVASQTVKRVALELGGKSANVILDDADLA